MSFTEFPFHPTIAESIESVGYANPTPIQKQAIPTILEGRDLIACAQTGTGKTAAYVLPVLDRILRDEHRHLNTLIIAPTRELVLQIDEQIQGFGYFTGISSISVYGGGDGVTYAQQQKALKEGADIVIATPGRLIAHLQAGNAQFMQVKHLILDEADRMLDMGFFDDIMKIIEKMPAERQTLLFSATMSPKIRKLATGILKNPVEINIAVSKPAEGIKQLVYLTHNHQKNAVIVDVLKNDDYKRVIIFASTKEKVKKLASDLSKAGIDCQEFHSDLAQDEREVLMNKFKANKINVLVGTDVLSRGIDVDGIELVINYDAPPDPEDYIHRIGRTARAERTGTAITLINEDDQGKFQKIEQMMERSVEKLNPPAHLGEGPAYRPNERRKHHHAGGKSNGKPQFKRRKQHKPSPQNPKA